MPKLDGVSLARAVRQSWPTIGIVVTSAEGRPTTLPEGVVFLQKPYRSPDLIEAIGGVILAVEGAGAPLALHSSATRRPGQQHGAGGIAQPLQEPAKE